jgi:hypothetical protein
MFFNPLKLVYIKNLSGLRQSRVLSRYEYHLILLFFKETLYRQPVENSQHIAAACNDNNNRA